MTFFFAFYDVCCCAIYQAQQDGNQPMREDPLLPPDLFDREHRSVRWNIMKHSPLTGCCQGHKPACESQEN